MPDVDDLAQEIRRVDGSHSLGAGALAEALMPFLRAYGDARAEAARPQAQRAAGHVPEHLVLAVDRWFAQNTGLGGCSSKDVADLAALFWGVHFDGGRESVQEAMAVVDSFGPGIQGLNDTFARQILLANEVRRLRGIYDAAVKSRREMREGLIATRQLLAEEKDRLDWLRENSCDLRCVDMPTRAGDADIHWVVIAHYEGKPNEREVGRAYTDDPRAAIDAARAENFQPPEQENTR